MSPRSSDTKKIYIMEALRLFAERGYEAVGVVEIAQAVGCTTSALYKHFSGKQELFGAILETCSAEYSQNMSRAHFDFSKPEERERIINMSVDEMAEMIKRLFLITIEDEPIMLIRKLATVEQYKIPKLAELYNEHYVKRQYEWFEKMLGILLESGVIKACDPLTAAVQLISPVIVMIGVCDRSPEMKEKALELIDAHVRQFNQLYRVNSD